MKRKYLGQAEEVFLARKLWGLRVRDLVYFNEALLGKWRWNLFFQSETYWVKVLELKYGRRGWKGLVDANFPKKILPFSG